MLRMHFRRNEYQSTNLERVQRTNTLPTGAGFKLVWRSRCFILRVVNSRTHALASFLFLFVSPVGVQGENASRGLENGRVETICWHC
jgi:hypothetical protein